jgi:hypothetical protein
LGFYGVNDILNVTAGGNVGIGTASPSFLANAKGLDIAGTGGRVDAAQDGTERIPTLRITDTVANYGSGTATIGEKRGAIEWYSTESSHEMPGISGAIYNINENSYNTQFGTAFYTFNAATYGGDGLAERMRIDNSGNVGIGTTGPVSEFQIGDQSHFQENAYGIANWFGGMWYNTTTSAMVRSASTTRKGAGIYINTGGHIGFLSAPETSGTTATASHTMFICNDGNVGIGETAPTAKLTISSYANGGINQTTPGQAVGTIHLNPASANSNWGNAITWGATNASFDLETAQAGIYVHSGGSYGSTMIFGTTDSFANGVKNRMTIQWDGKVGIGEVSPSYKLHVNGTTCIVGHLSATTKSFDIPHPIKPDKRLVHGSLEGPEHGVYTRGQSCCCIVDLPDYWIGLVDPMSLTVQLTAKGKSQELWVECITADTVYVGSNVEDPDYFYFIQAERRDANRLEVEPDVEVRDGE